MEEDDYIFLKIRDATTAINQKVNLIGVIVEFGLPKKTSGTDYCCTLKIIDESYPRSGISVNIFAQNMEMLPHIGSTGDIIQLSRVMMKTFNRGAYAVFNKKYSSFALYGGKDANDFLPYQYSSRFCQREQSKKFIAALRKWLMDFKLEEGTNNFSFLREIKEGGRFNLACKILHTCEVAEDKWMAFVWDGTDTPPTNIYTRLEDEKKNPLPLHLEPFPLSRDLLSKLPSVGTILRVIIDKDNKTDILLSLKTGEWVKLLNVLCEVNAGLWYGVLISFSKLRYMPKEDRLIVAAQRIYEKRLSSEWGRIPYWSFPWHSRITEVDYDHVPFVTLVDVLSHPEVTAKFKCVVRVVASLPWRAEDFRSPTGTYRIRFTLEDPTARIHAFLHAEDGEKFFDGYPSIDILIKKQNRLLGLARSDHVQETEAAPRNPPWVQCCLKSYYIDKSNIWGSRCYRIFGTKLTV